MDSIFSSAAATEKCKRIALVTPAQQVLEINRNSRKHMAINDKAPDDRHRKGDRGYDAEQSMTMRPMIYTGKVIEDMMLNNQ